MPDRVEGKIFRTMPGQRILRNRGVPFIAAICLAAAAALGLSAEEAKKPARPATLQKALEGTWEGETIITQGQALSMNKKAAGELKYPCTLAFDQAGKLVSGNVVGFKQTGGGVSSLSPLSIKVSFESGGKTYTQTLQGQLGTDGTQITGTLSYRLGGGTFTLKKKGTEAVAQEAKEKGSEKSAKKSTSGEAQNKP